MISEDLRWGVFPANFKKVSDGNGNRMVVRQDCAGEIDFNKCCGDSDPDPAPRYHGRAALRAISLSAGETALIRQYQHGGLLRSVTGPWFFTWPPRPFRELSIRGVAPAGSAHGGDLCGLRKPQCRAVLPRLASDQGD